MEIFNMICSAETGAVYRVQFLFQYLKNNSNIALSHLRHAIHQIFHQRFPLRLHRKADIG